MLGWLAPLGWGVGQRPTLVAHGLGGGVVVGLVVAQHGAQHVDVAPVDADEGLLMAASLGAIALVVGAAGTVEPGGADRRPVPASSRRALVPSTHPPVTAGTSRRREEPYAQPPASSTSG